MNSECTEALIERALDLQKTGNLFRAASLYKGIIRRNHRSARVYTNYGALHYALGDRIKAIELLQKAIECDPEHREAWENLWVDAQASSTERLAEIALATIEDCPSALQPRISLARGHLASGSPELAKQILEELIIANPDDLTLRELIVRCCLAAGDLDSAAANLLYITSLDPGNIFATIELAEIALKAGDSDSALQILNSAHQESPKSHEILFQLGRFHQSCGQLNTAISLYKQSLAAAQPNAQGNILANLAYCHAEIGEIEEFIRLNTELIEKDLATPENLSPLIFVCSTLGDSYTSSLQKYSELAWSKREARRVSFLKDGSPAHSEPSMQMQICSPLGQKRRRVGVLTGDLGTHVVASFLASFLLNYSKDELEVEIVSNRWRNDPIAERLSASADDCISIADYSEKAARDMLLERKYDLILETSGFTSGTAIFLLDQRCAPTQCHWIGYHASTFMPTMDYFIGDTILTPDSLQGQFSEKIAALPRAWLAATPFTAIPEARIKEPSDEIIIGSFSQIAKLTEETLFMWAEVLSKAPRTKLMLKDKFVGDAGIQSRIATFMNKNGISTDRIIFTPRTADWFAHMALYNQLDLALDTTPWSSATTAFDALSMGVPLISMLGKTAAGRMSSSVLHHCSRPEWIAKSPHQYVDKCLSVIDNIQHHRRSKRDYQAEVLLSQLYDGPHMARALEQFILSH
jgi:protein O-GlcNAc transferase